MSITLPAGIVLSALAGSTICYVKVAADQSQQVRVNYMSCCVTGISLCIAQSADKVFSFSESSGVDLTSATEINFDIWENKGAGASVLSKSLTGGGITLASPTVFQLDVTNTESGAMTASRKYCEAWVTIAGGDRTLVGAGPFNVENTRKFE